jgi:hypothetical protein
MKMSGQPHPLPFYTLETAALDNRLGGPQSRSGRGGEENKYPSRESDPGRQTRSTVTTLTELSRHVAMWAMRL